MDFDIITLPGLWNSGPQHWQTHWERKYSGIRRIKHRDWDHPRLDEWLADLDAAIAASRKPPVLAAHSLSCALVAHWAHSRSPHKIAGAFLVAPSDAESPNYPKEPVGFAPIPTAALPFPSMVVASTDDEYVAIERARLFARAWGSTLVEIGDAGHINGASGYGEWPDGERMLLQFAATCNP
jgi:hypothetical protein